MNRNYIILLLALLSLILSLGNVSGQKTMEELITVSSVIKDDSGNPLPEAKISGKEGAIVVWSDSDGKFTITVPPGSDLMIEKKGYFKQITPVSEISEVMTLVEAPFLMDDDNAVNIAFGKIKRKETADIIDVINPEDMLVTNSYNDWSNALEGRYFGRTLNNALVIIDGLPRMPIGLLAEQIEQITILKDVNASVLFGTQSRDGVIMITTKRGEAYKRRINFAIDRGIDLPVVLPEYLGSAKYMELYNEACLNDGSPALYDNALIENYKTGNPYRYPDVDYYSDEYLRGSRPVTRINTEFSGGNKSTQYYANLGWINSGSLYALGKGKDASTNDLNIRANANVRINDFVTSHLDATANFVFDKGPNGDFWNACATYHPYYYSPLIPVSLLDEGTLESLGSATKYINGKYILGGTTQYQDNVYGNMYLSGNNQNIRRLITVTNGIDVNLNSITEGLVFRTLLGLDLYNSFSQTVTNTYAVYQPAWSSGDVITGLTKIGKDEAPGVQNVGNAYFYRQITAQAILDYNRTFNEAHSVSATALGYYSKLRRDYFVIDDKASHIGFRVAYDYAKKYFIDFSSAYVHSIRLKEKNRDAFSPTIGLGWVVSEEDFMVNSKAVDYLKLKISAGILNTDVTEDIYNRFLYLSSGGFDLNYKRYESNLQGSGSFGWNDGGSSWNNGVVIVNGYANPDLTFEKVKNVNLGLESYLFNKSLFIDANLFYIKNSGIVVQRTGLYPAFLSDYIPYENYNANSYKGGELGINWLKTMGDFSVNLGTNLIYRTSNVDKRDEIYQNDFQYRKGNPVSAIFGLESEGFFGSESEINSSAKQMFGEVRPGDIKYTDQDNDGFVSENDMVYLGNRMPPFAYGVNLKLTYKHLSLFALFDGQNGGNSTVSSDYYWVDGNDKYSEEVLNRWTPATSGTATFPRLTMKSSDNNYRISDFWLYDNSFFRMNRVQLTYEFPRGTFSNLGVRGLSLYLRGSNLLMIGKDVEKMQLSIGSQPTYRHFAGGLRVSF